MKELPLYQQSVLFLQKSRTQHFNLLLCFNLSLWIPPDEAAASGPDELVVDRSYVKKKLEHGLTRIWQVSPSFTVYFICLFFRLSHMFFLCDSGLLSQKFFSPLSSGCPAESEGLHPGDGHVQL